MKIIDFKSAKTLRNCKTISGVLEMRSLENRKAIFKKPETQSVSQFISKKLEVF